MDLIWLIPLLPGLGAMVNGAIGIRAFSKNTTALVACSTMGIALMLSVVAFWQLPEAGDHVVSIPGFGTWIPPIPLQTALGVRNFEVPWAFRLDPLSGMMILVVTGIGFLIHVYSIAYMRDESPGGYARYFSYLNLFCFFMLMLVLGSNFLVMFVGWEGVGLCSYLLIGYWYEKKSASDAGKKAFIVNRIGDWGFILGIFLTFYTFGTLDFRAVANAAGAPGAAGSMPVETMQFGTLSLISLLLFIGATGKSAQIPLYVWLPDAMEGPTPVSALIHAATMVTAGVYMVGRNAVLFSHAPMVGQIVMIVGVLTALMAASIGLVQYDIKRVLAYSTVSQLGYMFLAMGVAAYAADVAGYAAGTFHLMTHAFFKALLFLCSGSVIHAMAGEQDMRNMGGLKKYFPVTYPTMLIGTFAIAGIFPLSGFFSKDEILYRTFLANKLVWGLAVVTALMTAFYMFRLISMTFLGTYRGPAWESAGHAATPPAAAHGAPQPPDPHAPGHGSWHGPHESPRPMTWPLMALAVGAIVAGFVGIPAALGGSNTIERFLEPSFTARATAGQAAAAEPVQASPVQAAGEARAAAAPAGAGEEAELARAGEIGLMALSVAVGVLGIWRAYRIYVVHPETSERLATRWSGAHTLVGNKYYVDELYNATFVRGTMESASGLWKFDGRVVDGAVNGSGWLTLFSSWISGLFDKYIVDGLVNLVGWTTGESSFVVRWLQTGLVQNYALWMLGGVFAFMSIYFYLLAM